MPTPKTNTMEEATKLAKRFEEVMLNGTWVANTNYKDALQDVSLEMASRKINNLNTIAALTFHINYYIEGVQEVLNGGELRIKDKYSFDAPQLTTEEEWKQLKQKLFCNAEQFAKSLTLLNTQKLNGPFVVPKYGTYQRNIDAIIEHSYYHLGQIILLKKLL